MDNSRLLLFLVSKYTLQKRKNPSPMPVEYLSSMRKSNQESKRLSTLYLMNYLNYFQDVLEIG